MSERDSFQEAARSVAGKNLLQHTVTVSGPALPKLPGDLSLSFAKLDIEDGLNCLFKGKLLLKSPSAEYNQRAFDNIDLNPSIGKLLTISIALDSPESSNLGDAGMRTLNAMVINPRQVGNEGVHRTFEFELRPWLYLSTLNQDWRIFQDTSVEGVLTSILSRYPYPVKKRLTRKYTPRDYIVQAGETDFSFLERLCAQFGIGFYFEHSDTTHTLVLTDETEMPNVVPGFGSYAYHAQEDNLRIPHISSILRHQALRTGSFSSSDYDFTRPQLDLLSQRRYPLDTTHNDANSLQEVYEFPGDYDQPDGKAPLNDDEVDALTLLRMEQIRSGSQGIQGNSNLRTLSPGYSFKLTRHPTEKNNTEYLITSTRLSIEDHSGETGQDQQWRCQCDFDAQPLTLPWRPSWNGQKPVARGPQVAKIVGNSEIWTDQYARVRVEFPWNRSKKNSSESTCWLRVSQPMAGAQWGAQFLPRQGQEIICDFIDGDYDRPIITGRVYNQSQMPPWNVPAENAISLSGFKTKELGGNGYNEFILDDAHGGGQVHLYSSHADSELNLGKIVRIPDHSGRQDERGDGFELRSDRAGAIRATGLYLTTDMAPQAEGHVLAMANTSTRLKNAQNLHEQIAALAQHQVVQDASDQQTVADVLKQHHGSITPNKAELKEADLVLSSAAGLHVASQQTLQLASEEHIALNAQEHISATSKKNLLFSAFEKLIVYVHRQGMKLFAEKGNIDITANDGTLNLTAQKDINIASVRGKITLQSSQEIHLNVNGTYYILKPDGIVSGTTGQWIVHSANKNLTGPDSKPLETKPGESCTPKTVAGGSSHSATGKIN